MNPISDWPSIFPIAAFGNSGAGDKGASPPNDRPGKCGVKSALMEQRRGGSAELEV